MTVTTETDAQFYEDSIIGGWAHDEFDSYKATT